MVVFGGQQKMWPKTKAMRPEAIIMACLLVSGSGEGKGRVYVVEN